MRCQRDGLGETVVADMDSHTDRAAGNFAPVIEQVHPLVEAQRRELARRASHKDRVKL